MDEKDELLDAKLKLGMERAKARALAAYHKVFREDMDAAHKAIKQHDAAAHRNRGTQPPTVPTPSETLMRTMNMVEVMTFAPMDVAEIYDNPHTMFIDAVISLVISGDYMEEVLPTLIAAFNSGDPPKYWLDELPARIARRAAPPTKPEPTKTKPKKSR